MSERKTLSITQVNEIQKVGDKQIPKLSFKANDGDKELTYFTFKSSLFEFIKEGQEINADVETSSREWDGQTYTDRRIVQVYVDGQPIVGKRGDGYRGKSPEELEQQARLMILAYAKDLAVAQIIPLERITTQADIFYKWVKPLPVQGPKEILDEPEKTVSNIDMVWLKESLEELNWADVGKWLKGKYSNAKGTTVKSTVESLTREQQEEFVKEVQARLETHRK